MTTIIFQTNGNHSTDNRQPLALDKVSYMKKILLAIDATDPGIKVLEFACYLARLTKSKITGAFLENLATEERLVPAQSRGIAVMEVEPDKKSDEYKIKMEMINTSISLFKDACIKNGVSFSLHRDRGVPIKELVSESRFADLLVVDAGTSFNRRSDIVPTDFIKKVLKKAECPVIIAPGDFDGIDEIIFTYDGSPSSIFSIKQFTYLFPELRAKKLIIIKTKVTGDWLETDKHKFKEWLGDHYIDLHFEAHKDTRGTKSLNNLFKRKKIFLIMGDYKTHDLEQLFKYSHDDLLIKTLTQPVFIAHLLH